MSAGISFALMTANLGASTQSVRETRKEAVSKN